MFRPLIGHVAPASGATGLTAFLLSLVSTLSWRERKAAFTTEKPHSHLKKMWTHIAFESALSLEQGESSTFKWIELKPPIAANESARPLNYAALPMVLIGLSPTLEDLHHAKQSIERLRQWGVVREALYPYVMNSGFSHGLPLAFIEKEVGPLLAVLPHDVPLMIQSENEGRCIQDIHPTSLLATSLRHMSGRILDELRVKEQSRPTEVCETTSLWEQEKEMMKHVWERWGQTPDKRGEDIIQEIMEENLKGKILATDHIQTLRSKLVENILGLGPVKLWLDNPTIHEIMIHKKQIYVEELGVIKKTTDTFETDQQLRHTIERMVQQAGRRVDWSSPMVDVRLPDGSRVNIVLPPVAVDGPSISIRKFRPQFKTMEDLVEAGTVTPNQVSILVDAIRARQNILIAGNTGSGKTTLLNILSAYISNEERIITLEDTAELSLQQEHVIRLEARSHNVEGMGKITLAELLKNALRMRPDRIIVGECRGAEVIPMLHSMNTGHDGSLTTLHANSTLDALRRLEALVLSENPQWPISFIQNYIRSGLNLILYLKREAGVRKLIDITPLDKLPGNMDLSLI